MMKIIVKRGVFPSLYFIHLRHSERKKPQKTEDQFQIY